MTRLSAVVFLLQAVWGLGFRVSGFTVGVRVQALGFKVWGLGLRLWGLGFRI